MRRAESGTPEDGIGSRVTVQASAHAASAEAAGTTTIPGVIAADKSHFTTGDVLASSEAPWEHVNGCESLPLLFSF